MRELYTISIAVIKATMWFITLIYKLCVRSLSFLGNVLSALTAKEDKAKSLVEAVKAFAQAVKTDFDTKYRVYSEKAGL